MRPERKIIEIQRSDTVAGSVFCSQWENRHVPKVYLWARFDGKNREITESQSVGMMNCRILLPLAPYSGVFWTYLVAEIDS